MFLIFVCLNLISTNQTAVDKSPEDILRENFTEMNINLEAFSSLRYVGIQTKQMPTDYNSIKNSLLLELENTAVRSARSPEVIFKAIDVITRIFIPFRCIFVDVCTNVSFVLSSAQGLNLKFSGKIKEESFNPFPEQYFTCGVHCESCDARCELSMGHVVDGRSHANSQCCRYQKQYENSVYVCKMCHLNGRHVREIFICKITFQNVRQKQSGGGVLSHVYNSLFQFQMMSFFRWL